MKPEISEQSLLVCSDPDNRGCGCERRGGPGVEVQVDHGVVGSAQAAKRGARVHLSVSKTLQVALQRTAHRDICEVHKHFAVNELMASVSTAHAILGDTDRRQ